MPAKDEFGAGSMTKRIATRRLAGTESASQSYEPAASASATPLQSEAGVYAVIEYQDTTGRKTFRMTKDQIVAGRGGRDYWTDLKLETFPDVSREHFRLRRDPASGAILSEGPQPARDHDQWREGPFEHRVRERGKAR